MKRRSFLTGLAAGPLAAQRAATAGKVIDAHNHLNHHSRRDWADADRKLIDAADKLHIDQLCCSILAPTHPATPELFRECNQWLYEAMQRFPGRVLGYCYVNPGYTKEALEEIRRCVQDRGFIGVKVYNDYLASEPVIRPVVELTIELGIPMLHHAGHATWLGAPQPRISDGGHLAQLANAYPEALIICAHIAGGGDWEWTAKAVRRSKTLFLDTSGSNIDEGMLDRAVKSIGVDRLLFACDLSMTASVGRARAAELSAEDRAKIMGGNMARILSRRKA